MKAVPGGAQVRNSVLSSLNLRVVRVPSNLNFQVRAKDGRKWHCMHSSLTCRPARGGTVDSSTVLASHHCSSSSAVRAVAKFRLHATPGTTAVGNGGDDLESEQQVSEGWEQKVGKYGELLSVGFPIWVAVASLAALIRPQAFVWVNSQVQFFGIVITMLGMGMTLSFKDFEGALTMPKELIAGVVLQYTVMPTAGLFVAKLLQLPAHYTAGVVLVACCPGGTASNVVTYLARGNVALSVLMTAASTFLAVVMTPLLTTKILGQNVAVDAAALFKSTIQVVLLPVLAGVVLNQFLPKLVRKISLFAPPIAVITVVLVCAGVIGQCSEAILSSGGQVLLAAAFLHALGFLGGYVMSHLLGFDEASARTISIEVGMQNSILGVVLAGKHFINPLTAVPCAVSSVCHSIFGSVLAGLWRLRPTESSRSQITSN